MLITSRDPLVKMIFSSEPSGIDLDPFTIKEAGDLVRKLTHDTDKDNVALKIAEALGGLPLAITHIAGIIRRQQLRLSEFYDAYQEQFDHTVFHSLRYGPGRPSYAHTISTVWVFESLGLRAKSLPDVLSFFDPDGIEEFIFKDDAFKMLVPSFPATRMAYIAARTELLQASLIRRKQEKDALWVHRLVQDSVRTKMTREFAVQVFWCASRLVWSLWPSAMSPTSRPNQIVKQPKDHVIKDRWPICEILFPHVLRLVVLYPKIIDPELPAPDLDFAFLLNDAGWFVFLLYWKYSRVTL